MKNIFIIGSKGIPANYGGFETFVDKLTEKSKNQQINYYVACMGESKKEFTYNGARCFNVPVPEIGSAKAVLYDILSIRECVKYIKSNKLDNPIIYILACRIGPFLNFYKNKLSQIGIKVYINPDGHEWKRSKWNKFIRAYWKYSEKLMIKNADYVICDSIEIQKYIKNEYLKYKPQTTYISYGADLEKSKLANDDKNLNEWYEKFNIQKDNYYLIVGRFVPENNYETIIREFMRTGTKKDLVIITNYEGNKFYFELEEKLGFINDKRVKFVGTLYDKELIKKIRENAYAYIHGHEVGGTNPSLLEALACTKVNLLYDVNFNKEVAQSSSLYFTKEINNLASLIETVEKFDDEKRFDLGKEAYNRIKHNYSWNKIVDSYEKLFLSNLTELDH